MKSFPLPLLLLCLFLILLSALAGCGSDSSNPFYPDSPGDFCFDRGGVSVIEYGIVYCHNGEYWDMNKN